MGLPDVPEVLQQAQHPLVLGQQQGGKSMDSLLTGALGKGGSEAAAHTTALPIVDHRDRQLGGRRILGGAHIPRDTDPVAGDGIDRDQRLVVVVVDLGEIAQLLLAQAGMGREEAAVPRPVAELLEALGERPLVLRLDRADQKLIDILCQGPGHASPHASTPAMSSVDRIPTGRSVNGSITTTWVAPWSTISLVASRSGIVVWTLATGCVARSPAVGSGPELIPARNKSRSETIPQTKAPFPVTATQCT
jgi:hypothetical protein